MKHLHQICAAVVLTGVLAATSFAGDIDMGRTTPQLPETSTTAGPLTYIALDLLQSVLLLF